MSRRPKPGRLAPSFEAEDQDGQRIRSEDLHGRWVVLYFYPKDETLGCTREACGFRDEFQALRQEGAVVLGVSRDSTQSHQSFAQHHGLPFSLLSDRRGAIQNAFGVRGLFGVARRFTFLIDPAGQVVKTYRVRQWNEHAHEVLADIQALKLTHKAQEPTKTEAL
jgi:thioredoxin-dependent peroxiredoxin